MYLNYGIHCLVNVVTEPEPFPAAVLIRALDPLEGIDVMRRRRARARAGLRPADSSSGSPHELCRGPGNLTKAMAITLEENSLDFTGDRLYIEDRRIATRGVVWDRRIGISVGTEKPWRAYLDAHPAVSKLRSKA